MRMARQLQMEPVRERKMVPQQMRAEMQQQQAVQPQQQLQMDMEMEEKQQLMLHAQMCGQDVGHRGV